MFSQQIANCLSTGEVHGVIFAASGRNPKLSIDRLLKSPQQRFHNCLVYGVLALLSEQIVLFLCSDLHGQLLGMKLLSHGEEGNL